MKVYADKLAADLKGSLRPLYIVSGDEPLLVQEVCDEIRQALKKQGFAERELFHAEANFDWTSLLYSAGSMSLFAEQKLLEVRLPSGKPGDKGSKALLELVDQLNEDTVLMLVMPRATPEIQRAKWFKGLESAGALIQVWPIEGRDLPKWLAGRFRRAGLKVSREAVQLMAERIEGNLLAAVQEIERLKLSLHDQQVDVQHVVEGVADSARFDVFKLIDAALAGNAARCIRMSSGLKAEGVELIFIISMLARELRTLELIKTGLVAGESRQSLLGKARVWKNRQDPVMRCLDRHDLKTVRELSTTVGRIDRMVKGVQRGDPWLELENILLGLAGVPVAPAVPA